MVEKIFKNDTDEVKRLKDKINRLERNEVGELADEINKKLSNIRMDIQTIGHELDKLQGVQDILQGELSDLNRDVSTLWKNYHECEPRNLYKLGFFQRFIKNPYYPLTIGSILSAIGLYLKLGGYI